MRTVYKYPVPASESDCAIVIMPLGAKPLHVGIQNNTMWVWALVDTERPDHPHIFYIRGTGQDCELPAQQGEHLASLQLQVGSTLIGGQPTQIVLHVFYAGPDDRLIPTAIKEKQAVNLDV